MKKLPLFLVILALPFSAFTQMDNLSLANCYAKAQAHYPLSGQTALLEQANALQLERIQKERLPEISWNAQASLQSEVVQFPFQLPLPPGESALNLPLYRIQTTADLQYTIYDGGLNEARQKIEKAQLAADRQQVQVELDKLKPQVNQFVFGILMQRERIEILRNSQSTMEQKIETLEAGQRHGVVLPADIDKLRVEVLRLQSEIEQAEGAIRGLVASLGELIGEPLTSDVEFALPDLQEALGGTELQRPELQLFNFQKESILAREDMITAARRPKVGAFVQAGLGLPNPLNFFDENLSPFAMGGVKFSWKIFDWEQSDRDRQLLALRSQMVNQQKESFESTIERMDGKYLEDIATLEQLMQRDEEIARLQEQVLEQVSAQLEQGVATSTDYITQANALAQARLNRQLHALQQQQIKVEYLTLKGQL
ncbi:MAG: TolC family protein [Phaeodactylibacter sp.]|nr:TolC family protein [Phaeodactylibacter sp.]MCB9267502.1 TolC family protein [Lewinellaceae bacterium]MCB9288095.1 TolC family protein [Lewinellaceae bacterium]